MASHEKPTNKTNKLKSDDLSLKHSSSSSAFSDTNEAENIKQREEEVQYNQAQPPNLIIHRTASTVISEAVFGFLKGSLYGLIWGIVTPFHDPPLPSATLTKIPSSTTGNITSYTLRPKLQLSSYPTLYGMGTNAAFLGSILGVQRFSSSFMANSRRKDDGWNDAFGFITTYAWYRKVLKPDKMRRWHNRCVGVAVLSAIAYANVCV